MDVTNDALIMWVIHSKALEGCLPNDYCIQHKSNTDCEEALLQQVYSEALQVKLSNLALNCLFFVGFFGLILHLPTIYDSTSLAVRT